MSTQPTVPPDVAAGASGAHSHAKVHPPRATRGGACLPGRTSRSPRLRCRTGHCGRIERFSVTTTDAATVPAR